MLLLSLFGRRRRSHFCAPTAGAVSQQPASPPEARPIRSDPISRKLRDYRGRPPVQTCAVRARPAAPRLREPPAGPQPIIGLAGPNLAARRQQSQPPLPLPPRLAHFRDSSRRRTSANLAGSTATQATSITPLPIGEKESSMPLLAAQLLPKSFASSALLLVLPSRQITIALGTAFSRAASLIDQARQVNQSIKLTQLQYFQGERFYITVRASSPSPSQ